MPEKPVCKPKRPRPWRPGQRIDTRFTVIGVIDDGGPEPVYIVWNHETWCPMALKRMTSPERARREGGVLDRLAHPNVVRCLGVVEPGYLLMEFLEGPTLSAFYKAQPGGRMRLSDALRTGVHIAAALHTAHERGYIHCDVKPRNVIVTPGGRPVLFDFGLARERAEWSEARLEGTDPYMPPEQCRQQPLSPATDVYALGVSLFEMITGKPPFPDGTKKREFPQLSMQPRRLRSLRPGAPRALEDLIGACLSAEAADRPALGEVMVGLAGAIRGGPPMWPAGFSPEAKPRGSKALEATG
ncbi:MAG: serine/threonine-protein kinase [Hyphomicrobiaceae bacterium]|nr:serine/threonine-protein kinase [Hyphomicrobiaceae bacterium]